MLSTLVRKPRTAFAASASWINVSVCWRARSAIKVAPTPTSAASSTVR
jgi:hypothetical protein